MEAFKLPIIGILFYYPKNGIEFFELQLLSYLFDFA